VLEPLAQVVQEAAAYAPSTRRWSYVSVMFISGLIAITSLPSSSWITHGRLTSA
jgi:hypothetical protein